MNKGKLIKEISEKSGATLKDTERFLNAFIEAVSKAMNKGNEVALVGFGTFSITERAERIGRNFKTGKNILIPASKSVKFKAGKTLREAVK